MDILGEYGKKKAIYLVTQFNHPREIATAQKDAIRCLLQKGIQVRNQTVLLRGVNDNGETLANLLSGLTGIGAVPYYVFQCRPVRGVKSRFQIPLMEGVEIVARAKSQQNGVGKCFRFAMSHPLGKIEILGRDEGEKTCLNFTRANMNRTKGVCFVWHSRLRTPGWMKS